MKAKSIVYHLDDLNFEREIFRKSFLKDKKLSKQFELIQFEDADSFLTAFVRAHNERAPEIAVLDFFLHEDSKSHLTGADLAQICRRLRPNTKVIMRSSLYDNLYSRDSLVEVQGYGADAFIPKTMEFAQARSVFESVMT